MNLKQFDRLNEIAFLAKKLSPIQQEKIIDSIKKEILLEQARLLDKVIKPNNISMAEINAEVKIVRKKRYEQTSVSN